MGILRVLQLKNQQCGSLNRYNCTKFDCCEDVFDGGIEGIMEVSCKLVLRQVSQLLKQLFSLLCISTANSISK